MNLSSASSADVRLEQESGYQFRVSFASGATGLVTDEAPPLGYLAGPDPEDLLAAAVGNCLASSLLFCLRKANVGVEGLSAEVALARERDGEGRVRVGRMHVRLEPRLAETDGGNVYRCLDLFETFGVVTESIRRGIPVDLDVVPVSSARDGARDCGCVTAGKGA